MLNCPGNPKCKIEFWFLQIFLTVPPAVLEASILHLHMVLYMQLPSDLLCKSLKKRKSFFSFHPTSTGNYDPCCIKMNFFFHFFLLLHDRSSLVFSSFGHSGCTYNISPCLSSLYSAFPITPVRIVITDVKDGSIKNLPCFSVECRSCDDKLFLFLIICKFRCITD